MVSSSTQLSLAQLEAAINAARAAFPSSGSESQLSPAVGKMAKLYGRMIFERRASLAISELSAEQLEVLRQFIELS